jgi:hypothetical protein
MLIDTLSNLNSELKLIHVNTWSFKSEYTNVTACTQKLCVVDFEHSHKNYFKNSSEVMIQDHINHLNIDNCKGTCNCIIK